MSLITPFGNLSEVDIDDISTLQEILLRSEKSKLLEGIVIERVFENYIQALEKFDIRALPASLVKSFNSRKKATAWWVCDHSENGDVFRVLDENLTKRKNHYVLPFQFCTEVSDFLVENWNGRETFSVQGALMKDRGVSSLEITPPDGKVVDELRSQQAIWALLSNMNARQLFEKVVLPRLFKNFAVQPFFNGTWDTDNLLQVGGRTIALEVKHKFPRVGNEGDPLLFGINVGQLITIRDLASIGINTLHMIMVKPKWDPTKRSEYLLNNINERRNVILLAKLIDTEEVSNIMQRDVFPSGIRQSITGRDEQKVRYLRCDEFNVLGTMDDTVEDIARNILLAVNGQLDSPAKGTDLERARIID